MNDLISLTNDLNELTTLNRYVVGLISLNCEYSNELQYANEIPILKIFRLDTCQIFFSQTFFLRLFFSDFSSQTFLLRFFPTSQTFSDLTSQTFSDFSDFFQLQTFLDYLPEFFQLYFSDFLRLSSLHFYFNFHSYS